MVIIIVVVVVLLSYPHEAINKPTNGIDPRITDHGVDENLIEWALTATGSRGSRSSRSSGPYGVACTIVVHTAAHATPTAVSAT